MADETKKKQRDPEEEKAKREADEARKAKERAEKEARLKTQKEAAAKQKAEKEAAAKAQKEAAAKQKAEKEAAAKAQKEAAAKQKAETSPKAETPQPEKPTKMTRTEKKELLERQKAREAELVEAGEIPLRNKYTPRGLFWRIFGVCLAFFMGIFSCLGGIVCAVVILLNRPSRDLLGQFQLDADQFISEAYLDKTVFELYDELIADINTLGDPSSLTLGTFTKYTPLIDTYLNDFVDANLKALGIALDIDGIKAQPFSELGNYVKTDLLPQIKLGPILGLDKNVTLESIDKNSPLYAIAYGKYGVDYEIAQGTNDEGAPTTVIKMKDGKEPKSITDLIPTLGEETDGEIEIGIMDVIGSVELGALLGFDIRLPAEMGQDNEMFYSICYGTEGEDYRFEDVEGGQILKLNEGKTATTVNDLLDQNKLDGIINGLALADIIPIPPKADLALRSIAYGPEMAKDASGNYLKDADGNYRTETVTDESGKEILQYVGGGRYVIEDTGDGAEIVMLPDPNDPTKQTRYPKKTIADLTDENGILGDVTIGSLVEIGDDAPAIMKALKDWTITDLTDSDKINGLKIGEVVDSGEESSGILSAMENWSIGDLNDQRHIERLRIGSIIGTPSSGLMKAIGDWSVRDLNDNKMIDSLTLGDILTINGNSPQMLQALENMTLGEISTEIDSLTLEEVLGKAAFNDGNKLLGALRYTKIKELGGAIDALTAEDVFGEDIWSYAKNYTPDRRPADADKVTENILTRYFHEGTELTPGYYTADGRAVPAENVVNMAYEENRVYVTRVPQYFLVDYQKDPSEWTVPFAEDAEILHDNYTAYYNDAAGVRHDLETKYVYVDGSGAKVEGKTTLVNKAATGEADKYYYLLKTPVSCLYAAPDGTTYQRDQVTEKYFSGDMEVTRYHAGVWYLLLGDGAGEVLRINQMGSRISGLANELDNMTLGTLYIHEITSRDPNVDITRLTANIPTLGNKTNLNQLTVNEVILLISALATN